MSVQAIVTGVVRKYNGKYVAPNAFMLVELKDRKAVELLAVRLTRKSKERLAWSWRVL